jgi:hypothetical protein
MSYRHNSAKISYIAGMVNRGISTKRLLRPPVNCSRLLLFALAPAPLPERKRILINRVFQIDFVLFHPGSDLHFVDDELCAASLLLLDYVHGL